MLNNNGTHFVDQALLLMGGDFVPEVWSQMLRTPLVSGDAEDHVKVLLKAPDGLVIDVEFTTACAYSQDTWLVMGTQGSLTGGRGQLRWKYIRPDELPPRPVDRNSTPDRSYNRETLNWTEETWEAASEKHTPATQQIYDELYATLRYGKPHPITLESLHRQSVVLQQCRNQNPV